MTFTCQAFSKLRCWTGVRASSTIATLASASFDHVADLDHLAGPEQGGRRQPAQRCDDPLAHLQVERASASPTASSSRALRARDAACASRSGWMTTAPWIGAA